MAARHTNRGDADAWCKILNGSHPLVGREQKVFSIKATWMYGPDSKIINYELLPD
jgi:hypothetical protein